MISVERKMLLPGIFPEFIGTSHMNKGFPRLMDCPHMNKGLPM